MTPHTDCDSPRLTGGDWGECILQVHINQGKGILLLLEVDGCDSPRWTGGDWGIDILQVTSAHCSKALLYLPPSRQLRGRDSESALG